MDRQVDRERETWRQGDRERLTASYSLTNALVHPLMYARTQDGFLQSAPLVYYFGHPNPTDNVKLYLQLVHTLASRIEGNGFEYVR